ncbi:MAG: DnaJ C-terminal domain-containing protein [Janthinobacterium lividum]
MKYKDYYDILGLQRSATQDEIKGAYRKLARKYHPDVNKEKDAEDRFKELGEAYQVLKDPEKRAAYDRMGSNWRNGQDFQPPPNWNEGYEFGRGGGGGGGGGAGAAQGDFSDFFETMFGGGGRRGAGAGFGGRRPMNTAGQDHHAKVVVDLEDSYRGAQRKITLRVPVVDEQGRAGTQERTLDVRIPQGVREGQKMRLSGQGAPGTGQGPAGDLFLEIAFAPHRIYRVDGRDVSLDLPLAPWEAALGATVSVPTPDGSVQMTIPPDSPAGRRLRLKGKGIPGTPPGDLYVQLQIALPPSTSSDARNAYLAMEKATKFDPRAHWTV